jgi:small-conductance mechanosensitive channel
VVLVTLLAAATWGLWETRAARAPVPRAGSPPPESSPVDESLLTSAQRLARLPLTAEERVLAQSALRWADQELEIAFTAALREIEAHPPTLSATAQQIQDRLERLQKLLDGDQASVARLTAALGQSNDADKSALQDRLDLAQSQLDLDRDELSQANADLLEAGGNQHQRIEVMMQEHAAAERGRPPAADTGPDPLGNLHGLARRFREWQALRAKEQGLAAAGLQASTSVAQLATERTRLAAQLEASKENVPELAQHTSRAPSPPPAAAASTARPAATNLLNLARQIGADQRLLTLLDQRIGARRQLAQIYRSWQAIARSQAQSVLHAMLVSVATVVAILLTLLLLDRWLEHLFARARIDRRQLETLRSVMHVALQILGVVVILLVLVGLPGQLGTMLGIVGAGLTVALKDFIVAFIGWLVLMGKNGIRLGDWVEINGVSGEVVQTGMFHTVLLETGSWTDPGHPTGRRVTFANSFAIQGHYLNFSTSGQWLWDELLVLVPYDRDPHLLAEALHKEVLDATSESTREAEIEWKAARGARGGSTSAALAPGIVVRPGVGGVEVVIRYVTRASERFALRARLYQTAVRLLNSARAGA